MNNYLITGKKQVGKSTLIKRLCKDNNINPDGFLTLPQYNELGERQGFYYHSLSPIRVFKNNQLIFDEKKIFANIFQELGEECLENTIKSDKNFIILDEIGRFERKEKKYIGLLNIILDSEKFVMGVLKKEDIEYINEIKKREDVKVFDLDSDSIEEVYKYLNKKIKEYKER